MRDFYGAKDILCVCVCVCVGGNMVYSITEWKHLGVEFYFLPCAYGFVVDVLRFCMKLCVFFLA